MSAFIWASVLYVGRSKKGCVSLRASRVFGCVANIASPKAKTSALFGRSPKVWRIWGPEKAIWSKSRARGAEVFFKTLPNKRFLPDNFPGGENCGGATWRRERNCNLTFSAVSRCWVARGTVFEPLPVGSLCINRSARAKAGNVPRKPPNRESGELYGRPNGTPAVTVCTGLRCALPSRLLLRVSTNDTGPSTNSMIATSPGAPTCSVPSFGTRLIDLGGIDRRHGDDLLEREAEPHELAHHPGEVGHAGRVAGEHVDVGRDRVGRAPCAIAGSATV